MSEDFPDIHPRGRYHVELPYSRITTSEEGSTRHRRDMFDWIRENCAPVEIRTYVRAVGFCTKTMKTTRHARIMFLYRNEAIMFKLRWA